MTKFTSEIFFVDKTNKHSFLGFLCLDILFVIYNFCYILFRLFALYVLSKTDKWGWILAFSTKLLVIRGWKLVFFCYLISFILTVYKCVFLHFMQP